MQSPIPSPCTKVCRIAPQLGLCIGCGRTLDEIAAWPSLTGAERDSIMRQLPARLSLPPSTAPTSRTPAALRSS